MARANKVVAFIVFAAAGRAAGLGIGLGLAKVSLRLSRTQLDQRPLDHRLI